MEKESVINNPFGFSVPVSDNTRDIVYETNIIDAENPPEDLPRNPNDPNEPGDDPYNPYPPGHRG